MNVRKAVAEQWPMLVVAAVFVAAFTLVALNFWRRGALLLGIGVGVAAALRLLLADGRAGLLVVRSKRLDVATMVSVGAAILYIAKTIDPLGTG